MNANTWDWETGYKLSSLSSNGDYYVEVGNKIQPPAIFKIYMYTYCVHIY